MGWEGVTGFDTGIITGKCYFYGQSYGVQDTIPTILIQDWMLTT